MYLMGKKINFQSYSSQHLGFILFFIQICHIFLHVIDNK